MRQARAVALVLLIAASPLPALAQNVPADCVATMDPPAYLACISQRLSALRMRIPSWSTEHSVPLTELGTRVPHGFKDPSR